jgi:hypothetical protein
MIAYYTIGWFMFGCREKAMRWALHCMLREDWEEEE